MAQIDPSDYPKKKRFYLCNKHFDPISFLPSGRLLSSSNPVYTTADYLFFQQQKDSPVDDDEKNRHCCASGCDVSLLTHPDVGLFKFYPSQRRFEKWCLIARLQIRETKLAFCLCARHFHRDCFVDEERRNLKASSDPMYPTRPLNKFTGNYCPLVCTSGELPLLKIQGRKPAETIVIDDDGPGKSVGTTSVEPPSPATKSGAESTANESTEIGNLVDKPEDVSQLKKCCHFKCNNNSQENKEVRFFRLPNHPDPRTDFWKKAAGASRVNLCKKAHWLCSDHFESSQFHDKFTLKDTAMPILDVDSLAQIPVPRVQLTTCDALGCPVTNITDPLAKFFCLRKTEDDLFDQWKAMVGGVSPPKSELSRLSLCQYHFPEKAFLDAPYRSRLTRSKSNTLFPVGPINPRTGDYCPAGQEELSIMYHEKRILTCCCKGCTNLSPLFKFPYYDDKAFDIWCERIGVCRLRYSKEYITNILAICSVHFDSRCKVLDIQTDSVFLNYGALPTLKLPNFRGRNDNKTTMLKTDKIPPNADELARSLLIKPNEGVPPKRTLADDECPTVPEKKSKPNDAEIKSTVLYSFQNRVQSHWGLKSSEDGKMVMEKVFPKPGEINPPTTGTGSTKRTKVGGDVKPKATIAGNAGLESVVSDMCKLPTAVAGQVKRDRPRTLPGNKQPTIFSGDHIPGKPGPKKKFEPNENRPSLTIKEFIDDFMGDMSPPACSPPPSPGEWDDPLATMRDTSVQTDSVDFESEAPKKPNKKALHAFEALSCLDVGNEVDVLVSENKIIDKSVWNQVNKEMALEKALVGVFNQCKAGEDNAFSSLSDRSAIPERVGGHDSHQYSTQDTVNVIRSAAELCEFNTLKILQLEQLMQKDEEKVSALEDTIVEHLNAVMCITGVELIRKCFERVLKDAINREKANEKKVDVTIQIFDGKKKSELQVPIYDPNLPTEYSEETKQMCKALMAYSGKAYTLLKQVADLPQPQLVRYWSTYPDGSPGYSSQAIDMLRQYHKRTKKTRFCSLSVVDVPLKKDVFWDGKRLFGYEDLGFGYIDDDSIREASKAVVFYVKMLTEDKRLPVGYCLADKVTPQVRANLINQCITHLDTLGIRCVALVCDYSVTTYETYVELGAAPGEGDKGWFHHPLSKGVRVMCFTDVFQNVQALSNLWAEKKTFRPSPKADTAIDREHIAEGDAFLKAPSGYKSVPVVAAFLSELKSAKCQVQKDPLMANKYNAVMLTILRDLGVKKFASTSQTIKYLESLTAVTDLFSSNHPHDIADRRPLSYANSIKIQSRLTILSSYFAGLCCGNGTKILSTNRKLPVLMLKMNLCSLRNLVKRIFYGEKNKNTQFYTKSLSLEDVTAATATITGGARRLVTASEFKKAFKKYMDGYTWTPSERLMSHPADKFPVTDVCLGFHNTYVYEYAPFNSVSESALEFLTETVIETWLENVKCLECSQTVQKGILSSREFSLEGNLVQDIHRMIRTAESCLAVHPEIPGDSCDAWFNRFSNEILNSLTSLRGFKGCRHLFVSVRFGEISHFTVMVKDMLRIYLQLRLSFMDREERIKIQAPRERSMKFNLGRSWT